MQRIRSFLFWCHLATGVCVGAIVLLMSATGVLLTYQRQTIAWAETRGLDREAPPAAPLLPLDSLLDRARGALGAPPTTVTWRADAPRLAEIAAGREGTVYLDRSSGEVVGRSDARLRAFFAAVTSWHRWLGAGTDDPAARARGRAVTGAANLGFLFLVLSGLWLWWPRNLARGAVRAVTLFRRGLRGKARDFNWHNVIGIWSFVPLVVVVASGVVISYPWASALVYRAFGERPPASSGRAAPPGATPAGAAISPAVPYGMDAMLARAASKAPGWRSITLTVPRSDTAAVSFAIDHGTGGQPQKRATLALDPATGAELRWEPFASQTPGRRARAILRFAHTGEVLGIVGQTIAGLVSLGAVVMVWTGISLSLRRLAGWRRSTGDVGVTRRRARGRAAPRAAASTAAPPAGTPASGAARGHP